ncbi:MAG: PilZ domain-containing protein [Oligoflexales bacterium]|nr:PilZ domain-containing protein [Oligoflexales bacterium]
MPKDPNDHHSIFSILEEMDQLIEQHKSQEAFLSQNKLGPKAEQSAASQSDFLRNSQESMQRTRTRSRTCERYSISGEAIMFGLEKTATGAPRNISKSGLYVGKNADTIFSHGETVRVLIKLEGANECYRLICRITRIDRSGYGLAFTNLHTSNEKAVEPKKNHLRLVKTSVDDLLKQEPKLNRRVGDAKDRPNNK